MNFKNNASLYDSFIGYIFYKHSMTHKEMFFNRFRVLSLKIAIDPKSSRVDPGERNKWWLEELSYIFEHLKHYVVYKRFFIAR